MPFVPDQKPTAPAAPAGRFVPDAPKGYTVPGYEGYGGAAGKYVNDWGAQVGNAVAHPDVDPNAPAGGPISGTLETVGALASSIGAPVAGALQWGGGKLFGTEAGDRPLADVIEGWRYYPQTQVGQANMGVVGAALKPLADAFELSGKGYGDIAGLFGADEAAQGDIAALMGQSVPATLAGPSMVKGARAVPGAVRSALDTAGETIRGNAEAAGRDVAPAGFTGAPEAGRNVARMRAYGYPVMPSQAAQMAQREAPAGVMPSVPGHLRETLTNPGETRGRFMVESAKNTEGVLRNELAVPEGTPLSPAWIEAEMARLNAAYDMVPQALPQFTHSPAVLQAIDDLGAARRNNPYLQNAPQVEALRARLAEVNGAPTQQVLDAIREFRSDARRYFQSTGDRVLNDELAQTYRSAADALEQGIAEQLQATGQTPIFEQFQDARVRQAKLHNVLDSWVGADPMGLGGELDPHALAALKGNGAFTGGLADIVDAATQLPETVRLSVGESIRRPSNAGQIMEKESAVRRYLFDRFIIPNLLSDAFQGRYGSIAGRSPGLPFSPFAPSQPNMGPQQPPPPPEGRFPRNPAGEGPLDLAPEPGGMPFSNTQLPTVGGEGVSLVDVLDALNRTADSKLTGRRAGGLELVSPLDEGGGPRLGQFGSEPMTPTPGVQPGASVGLSDPLTGELPAGAANAWGESPGAGQVTGRMRGKAGGKDTRPEALNVAPENAHELPGSIGDIMAPPEPSPYGALPPELQAIVDALAGKEPPVPADVRGLDAIGEALAPDFTTTPSIEPGPVPMNPPKGSRSLRGLRDELNVDGPAEPAAPGEFADLSLEDAPPRPEAPELKGPPTVPLPKPTGRTPSGLAIHDNVEPNVFSDRTTRKGDTVLADESGRRVILEPRRDETVIRWTEVPDNLKGQRLGIANTLDAVRLANERGKAAASDSELSTAQIRVWKSLFRDGKVTADAPPDWAAIDKAAADNGGKARNRSGDSWIKGIRIAKKSE